MRQITYGDTLSGAERNAQDALGLHLYEMEKDGDPVPAPCAVPEVDPETVPEYLVCPITVFPSLVRSELDNRRVKTNVIPVWVRELAQERGSNCSKLLEEAILDTTGIHSISQPAERLCNDAEGRRGGLGCHASFRCNMDEYSLISRLP